MENFPYTCATFVMHGDQKQKNLLSKDWWSKTNLVTIGLVSKTFWSPTFSHHSWWICFSICPKKHLGVAPKSLVVRSRVAINPMTKKMWSPIFNSWIFLITQVNDQFFFNCWVNGHSWLNDYFFFQVAPKCFWANKKDLIPNYGYQKLVTKFIVLIATRFIVVEWRYFLPPLIAFGATSPCFDLGWPLRDTRLHPHTNTLVTSWQTHGHDDNPTPNMSNGWVHFTIHYMPTN